MTSPAQFKQRQYRNKVFLVIGMMSWWAGAIWLSIPQPVGSLMRTFYIALILVGLLCLIAAVARSVGQLRRFSVLGLAGAGFLSLGLWVFGWSGWLFALVGFLLTVVVVVCGLRAKPLSV